MRRRGLLKASCNNNAVDGTTDGHQWVIINGTKWAKVNVGASNETNKGNFYQYGKGSNTYQTTSGQSKYTGTENPLSSSYDTATQAWGSKWRMPTSAECQALMDGSTYELTNINGVNGIKFTSNSTCKYIFFPTTGFY